MQAICVLFAVFAACIVDAAEVSSTTYKLTKNPNARGSNGKRLGPLPIEWINISMKSDPVITVPSGRNVELECEAVGSPPPSVKWHHGNTFVTESGIVEQNEVVNSAIGKVRSRLVIDCVTPQHAGSYSCSGTSGAKSKNSSPITLLVEDRGIIDCQRDPLRAPRIVVWQPTILETIDKDVTLPCNVIGNPRPEIYWVDSKNEVITRDLVSPHYKVLENGDLIISQVVWDDMGTYTCVAQNTIGTDKIESFVYPVKKETPH